MCAMKYVFLFTFEREKESELECIAAYLSIFQGCNIEKTTTKIPIVKKQTKSTSSLGKYGHTTYPIFRKLITYTLNKVRRILCFNTAIMDHEL